MGSRELVPWYGKMAAKIVLSRIPVPYAAWRRLRLFSHGDMAQPIYAYGVFREHFDRTEQSRKGPRFVALELGPGDSLLSAVAAAAHGSSQCFLVDSGEFALADVAPYQRMARELRARGLPVPDLDTAGTLSEILERCRAQYLTDGLVSLKMVPSSAVDFIWSHAVLEHIRKSEFEETVREMRRILGPGGMGSHQVDLRDHLNGGLNNLRFPGRVWEQDWMAKSGFYTNRIRFTEMLEVFHRQGFRVDVVRTTRYDALPIRRADLAEEFRALPDDELMISGFSILVR